MSPKKIGDSGSLKNTNDGTVFFVANMGILNTFSFLFQQRAVYSLAQVVENTKVFAHVSKINVIGENKNERRDS